MKIETKYALGETVHAISNSAVYQPYPCPTCAENGKIEIGGEAFVCPKCDGKKMAQRTVYRWYRSLSSTIGQVRIVLTVGEGAVEEYMLHATGIGGGSLYRASRLYSTKEAADTECNRRNDGGEFDDYNPVPWEST